MQQKYQVATGNGNVSNSSVSATLIAGVAGKTLRVTFGTFSVTTAATGGGGRISLKDGSNIIMSWDGNAAASHTLNYGESTGYPLTQGNSLVLVVEGAVSNQATGYGAVIAYFM